MSPDGVPGSRNSHQVQDLQLVVYLLWQKLQIHTTERNRGQTLSDPHEIKLSMAEHQAAHGVLTKRPSWPPE